MEKLPGSEAQIKKYTYRDNFKNREIVFECETEGGILEADRLLKEATGIDAFKKSNIACLVEDVEKN